MEVIYAQEPTSQKKRQSIFLVGPTPRSKDVKSWRPEMIEELRSAGFEGTVYSPEPRDGEFSHKGYTDQVEWEIKHLDLCDIIIAWVARKLPDMPAFTTNVEFGRYIDSGKMLYGRPFWAEKIRYLDWLCAQVTKRSPFDNMREMAETAVDLLKLKRYNN